MADNNKKTSSISLKEDVIFFKEIIYILIKNKLSIIVCTIFFSIVGLVYANFKKPTWGGEFQIVLKDDNSNDSSFLSNVRSSELLKSFAGIDSKMGNIKTEVEILTSQSILRPIYKSHVKKTAKAMQKPYVSYKKWLKSLNVKLKKGTNVLDISYIDKNKNSVIPILNKISKRYQDYSGENTKRGFIKASIYLKEQIALLNSKSKNSLDELQTFSIENKIGSFDGLPNPNNLEPDLGEAFKDSPSNTTNSINSSDLFKDPSFNRGIDVKSTSISRYKTQFLKLEQLETKLKELKAFYKPESEQIRNLNFMIEELKNSLKRPKEVLLRYRELYRRAMRDEKQLTSLEDELSALKMASAKQTDPWKLISTPTLIEEPVAPNKVYLFLLSSILGFISSLLFFIFKSYRSELVLNSYRLIDLFQFPLLKTFNVSFMNKWENDVKLLIKKITNEKQDFSLGILPLCNSTSENYALFYELLSKNIAKKKITVSTDLLELDKCNKVLLIISRDDSKYNEIYTFIESLKLSAIDIEGWIFIQ